VHKVADKYNADLDGVIERATTVLAQDFSDGEQLARRRDQFVGQLCFVFVEIVSRSRSLAVYDNETYWVVHVVCVLP